MNMMKKKGLGHGLEALLGSPAEVVEAVRQEDVPTVLELGRVQPGKYQPHMRVGEGVLQELATSVRTRGLTQSILMRKVGSDGAKPRYEIIVGERHFYVSRLAGLTGVPILVRDVPDESTVVMALIENIRHEDPNPLEEAQGIACLVHELQFTHGQAAELAGRSCNAMSDLLHLFNSAQPIQTMLMAGDLNMGRAHAPLVVDGTTQIILANQTVNKCLSVCETEKLVASTLKPFKPKSLKQKGGYQGGRDAARLEEELAGQFGLGVQIKLTAKGRGQLAVRFGSLDGFDRLLACLRLDAGGEAA